MWEVGRKSGKKSKRKIKIQVVWGLKFSFAANGKYSRIYWGTVENAPTADNASLQPVVICVLFANPVLSPYFFMHA